MMKNHETYCGYILCKALKKAGFNWPCRAYCFDCDFEYTFFGEEQTYDYITNKSFILIPTLQMACQWLRETHNIHIEVLLAVNGTYFFNVYQLKPVELLNNSDRKDDDYYDTYERACELGLLYALQNYIKDYDV